MEADYKALQEKLASTRLTAARRAEYEKANAAIIRAYKNRKKVVKDKWTAAEERLVSAVAELRERNVKCAADEQLREAEDKLRRKAAKEEEKQARKDKEAAEKAERKQAEEQKKEAELELKTKARDERAKMLMDAKARTLNTDKQKAADAALQRSVNVEMKGLLHLMKLKLRAELGIVEEEKAEDESDKENVEPADE